MNIKSEMRRAWENGITSYTPEGLDPETGDPKVTLSNARKLLETLNVRDIEAKPDGPVLITFLTGEEFLATGFRLNTPELAEFVIDAGLDERVDLVHTYLKSLPSDLAGPICWPGFNENDPQL
jgi:hypothetical protein